MNVFPNHPEEPEGANGDTHGVHPNPGSPEHVQADREPIRLHWKEIALLVGGGAMLVGATVVVTLAATHESAVRENLKAYINGLLDGLAAHENGLLDDVDFD